MDRRIRTRDRSVCDGLDAGRRQSGRLGQVLGLLPLGHPLQPVSLDVLLHVVPEIVLPLVIQRNIHHDLYLSQRSFSKANELRMIKLVCTILDCKKPCNAYNHGFAPIKKAKDHSPLVSFTIK